MSSKVPARISVVPAANYQYRPVTLLEGEASVVVASDGQVKLSTTLYRRQQAAAVLQLGRRSGSTVAA